MNTLRLLLLPFLLLPLLLCLSLGCCLGQKTTQTPAILQDFVIMAYSGPPADEVTPVRYQEIADAGIEYLVPGNGAFDGETNLKAMDLAQQAGIKILPIDERLMPFVLGKGMPIDPVAVKAMVQDYHKHPAMAAYVVKDEPHADMFPALKIICDVFRELDPAHEPLINLFPSYGSLTQLGFEDFRAYIASFIDIVKPRLLSYDFYPFRLNSTLHKGWFHDLAIVREETRKARIPFMVFMQSEGITEGLRVPNRAEILWQVNTALAYGARGVGWFCYWTPAPDQGFKQEEGAAPPIVEHHHNAMISRAGKPTEIYDYVKEANHYLKKAGKALLGWDNTDVARFEGGQRVTDGGSPCLTPKGVWANVAVGTYRRGDRARVVLTNLRCNGPAEFSLAIKPGWKITGMIAAIDAAPVEGGGGLAKWRLQPGGSVVLDVHRHDRI